MSFALSSNQHLSCELCSCLNKGKEMCEAHCGLCLVFILMNHSCVALTEALSNGSWGDLTWTRLKCHATLQSDITVVSLCPSSVSLIHLFLSYTKTKRKNMMNHVTVGRSQRRMFALLIHKTFPSKFIYMVNISVTDTSTFQLWALVLKADSSVGGLSNWHWSLACFKYSIHNQGVSVLIFCLTSSKSSLTQRGMGVPQ